MNRDIKFRAWDLDHNWMMDDCFYVGNDGTKYEPSNKAYDVPCTTIEENPNLVLMQYTGLKDKNGKEIYEGDIVRHIDWEFNEVLGDYQIVFSNEYGLTGTMGFHAIDLEGKQYDFYGGMPDISELQVIGNIYENPELLKATK